MSQLCSNGSSLARLYHLRYNHYHHGFKNKHNKTNKVQGGLRLRHMPLLQVRSVRSSS